MTPTSPDVAASARPPRIQLDTLTGLRGILALSVFSFHISINYVWDTGASDVLIRGLIGPGEAALSFFFILSGFVLVWVARPGEPRRNFYRRRVVKIFPNHLVTWVAGLALMLIFGVFTGGVLVSLAGILPSLVLIQPWVPWQPALEGTNGPAWSLACDMFFYLLFPWLLAKANRIDPDRLWRWTIGCAASIIAMTAVVGLLVPSEPKAVDQDVSAYQFYLLIFFPPARLLDFCLGILIARLVMTGRWRPVKLRWIAGLLLLGWALSATLPAPLGFVAPFIPGLLLMTGTAASVDLDGVRNVFTRRVPVWLGDVSFGFYIVHGLVIIYAERAIGSGPYPWWGALLFTAGTLSASLFLGWLLHTRVELPAMARWSRPRKRPAPAVLDVREPLQDPRPVP